MPPSTRDAVETDTPAAAATSRRVTVGLAEWGIAPSLPHHENEPPSTLPQAIPGQAAEVWTKVPLTDLGYGRPDRLGIRSPPGWKVVASARLELARHVRRSKRTGLWSDPR
jgi:hypothetical protein